MQEEYGQFTRNEVCDLVPRPKYENVSKTIEFELWYTQDLTTSLNGSYDVEAKYIVTNSSYSPVIWIKKKKLKDYGVS